MREKVRRGGVDEEMWARRCDWDCMKGTVLLGRCFWDSVAMPWPSLCAIGVWRCGGVEVWRYGGVEGEV